MTAPTWPDTFSDMDERAATADFFSDAAVVHDPGPYFTEMRARCPVAREPHHGAFMVTGYDAAMEVLNRRSETFSNAVSVFGPIPPLPFAANGDDISAILEEHRADLPWSAHLISLDGEDHARHRALVTRLLTHGRLKRNEAFLVRLADRLIDRFAGHGSCEIVGSYAHALSTLAIADLLGVPEEEHEALLELLGAPPTQIEGDPEHKLGPDPLAHLEPRFLAWIEERRREEPRDDLLSELAHGRFRDGSAPEPRVLARLATFLFGAGQDTSARLIATAFRLIGEEPALQERLRAERGRIVDFIEECLRWDAPTKVNFRLCQRSTEVAGVPVSAGSVVTVGLWAANRDPARFADPDIFDIERPGLRDHLAFSRGAHACPGAPLARMEARVAVERFLARAMAIRIDEERHGPAGARRYEFEPTYMLRSLSALHLRFEAA